MERELILYEFFEYPAFSETCLRLKEDKELFRAYLPLPEDELAQKLNVDPSWPSRFGIIGGITGIIVGFCLQIVPNLLSFPQNIGGRPLLSMPAFIPIAFELCVLFSALGVTLGFILNNKYPRFDRAIFASEDFNQRSHKHYFLCTTREIDHVQADAVFRIPSDDLHEL